MQNTQQSGISRELTWLLSVACAVAVGNLYWIQPLLTEIAEEFNISSAAAGNLVTATQVGYASGVLLLVPLGDSLNRKRLVPMVMIGASIALFLSAMASNYVFLLACLASVGFLTISGQLMVPLAGSLASDEQRGKILGTLSSGILSGILLSRAISGLLADIFGWRAIYFIASFVSLILAIIVARNLPPETSNVNVRYIQLLSSVIKVVQRYRSIQITLLISFCIFVVFSLFWTSLTFLLSAAPFSYSVTEIGMVGLLGFAGALAARNAGKLHDKGASVSGTGYALLAVFIAIIISGFGAQSIVLLIITVLLLDMGIQTLNVLNQTRILALEPQSRSRINTAFIVVNFVGAAAGSAMAGILWQHGGWLFVVVGEVMFILFAMTCWVLGRDSLNSAALNNVASSKPVLTE